MIKEFEYRFNELDIVPSDIEELLGFDNNEIPEPFPGLIKKGLSEAPAYCNTKGGVRIFDSIKIDASSGTLIIGEQTFSPAKIVMQQLKDATGVVVFVCTAGNKISNYSKSLAAEGEELESYIMDVIGSVVVEKAMVQIELELEQIIKKEGYNISDNFSPGYCEWNVHEQQKLFKLLPADFCGIKLSDSSLMDPIKSVSGIIGIGAKLKKKGYQCYWCNDLNCTYGKRNRKKISKKVD